MIIGIDVDLVIVRTDLAWWNWMEMVTGVTKTFPIEKPEYNLSSYWKDEFEYLDVSPFDFWEDPVLYDKLSPIKDCVFYINKLKEEGHSIRFISDCKKGHYSSKVRFIKKHFNIELGGDSDDGFYATKEKHGVYVDVMIDDRAYLLSKFKSKVIKILYETTYKNDLVDNIDFETNNWYEIYNFIKDIE